VKTVKDLSDKDRIGMPAVKISVQALALQMAAEQAFGPGQQNRLDSLTVTMAHPDAMQALLSGQSEINAHFGSPPFQYQELAKPGMHMVLNNYDVMGGAVTFNLVWTTEKFRSANPKLYGAFVMALDEAEAIINRDKRAAAEAYIRISKDKDTVDNIARMMNDPQIVYTTTPQNVMKYADFMAKTGAIKNRITSGDWMVSDLLWIDDALHYAYFTARGREPGRDPGDYRLLRRYERRRAEPILAMDTVVSGLFALYGARSDLAGRLRNAGLNLTDRLPVLKNILMRQAMS